MPTNKQAVDDGASPARPWHEDKRFDGAIFVCLPCGVRYDPPPTPAVCPDCDADLTVAVLPREAPAAKSVILCSNCGTESQKAKLKLNVPGGELGGGPELLYCPECGSTAPSLNTVLPLSEDETASITERNAKRAEVRAQAEAITTVKAG